MDIQFECKNNGNIIIANCVQRNQAQLEIVRLDANYTFADAIIRVKLNIYIKSYHPNPK